MISGHLVGREGKEKGGRCYRTKESDRDGSANSLSLPFLRRLSLTCSTSFVCEATDHDGTEFT